jgi:quercetin dioxygenase-like cupin family protein
MVSPEPTKSTAGNKEERGYRRLVPVTTISTCRPPHLEHTSLSRQSSETRAGGAFEWHDAPARQFVITLSGTLDFQTRTGEHFMLHPGDILLAEDTAGTGHSWKLVDENPWRRAYVILGPGVEPPFIANSPSSSPA